MFFFFLHRTLHQRTNCTLIIKIAVNNIHSQPFIEGSYVCGTLVKQMKHCYPQDFYYFYYYFLIMLLY